MRWRLCAGEIPAFLDDWMDYCRGLQAWDLPNYDYLRGLLKRGSAEARPRREE